MKRLLAGLALLAGSVAVVPVPAHASGGTDAALALGAFAVLNQLVRGETIFQAPLLAAPAPPVLVQPQPVFVRQPPVYVAPPPVIVMWPPVYAPALPPVLVFGAPVVIYRRIPPGHDHRYWEHARHREHAYWRDRER